MFRLTLSLVFVCALCGLSPAGAAEPQEVKAGVVDVRLTEYAIEMPHTLAAGPTTFTVHNEGRKNHSFKVEGPGLTELLEKSVSPGATGQLRVTLQPGEYKVYCPIGSHSVKGMTTTLVVTAPAAHQGGAA
jgi:uncharacterized cupredoxin-like copper-binding protein